MSFHSTTYTHTPATAIIFSDIATGAQFMGLGEFYGRVCTKTGAHTFTVAPLDDCTDCTEDARFEQTKFYGEDITFNLA